MYIKELNEIATKQDLEEVKTQLVGILLHLSKINPIKEFYSPKEFAQKTSIPYSTVVYKCSTGKLKAFQESPNGSWLIYASELERMKQLAFDNIDFK